MTPCGGKLYHIIITIYISNNNITEYEITFTMIDENADIGTFLSAHMICTWKKDGNCRSSLNARWLKLIDYHVLGPCHINQHFSALPRQN